MFFFHYNDTGIYLKRILQYIAYFVLRSPSLQTKTPPSLKIWVAVGLCQLSNKNTTGTNHPQQRDDVTKRSSMSVACAVVMSGNI